MLEAYIRQHIVSQPPEAREIHFAWQGGEPTLLGVDYFQNFVALQRRFSDGRPIHNAMQTNGTLLDDSWGEFLSRNGFLIGLSIDGPEHLHHAYRTDKRGRGSFSDVMRGLDVLRRHRVEFNTLTVVSRANVRAPLEVYRFLKFVGSGFIQFIPLVERQPQTRLRVLGMDFAEPPTPDDTERPGVTHETVPAAEYGEFLVQIFDDWVQNDVGNVLSSCST